MGETDKKYMVCGVEICRCQIDGRLQTMDMLKSGFCAGHRLAQPAFPTLLELLLLKLGLYETMMPRYWGTIAWIAR